LNAIVVSPLFRTFFYLFWVSILAGASNDLKPPKLVTQNPVDTNPIPPNVLLEPTLVRIVVDQDGKPFSIRASSGISRKLADSIANWKFLPGRKDGRRAAFEVAYTVPERHQITPDFEWGLGTTWQPSGEIIQLFDLAREWDQTHIRNAAKVRNDESRQQVTHGVALLHTLFTGNAAEVRRAREEHLVWMIQNRPQLEILGGPAALIASADEPFADAELRQKVATDWIEQVNRNPGDFDVLDHAIHFLRFIDSSKALNLIQNAKGWPKAAQWLGHLYALQGVGISGFDPRSGRPLIPDSTLPATPAAIAGREALLHSQNTEVVLSGLAAITVAKEMLDESTPVPKGYEQFCEALRAHASTLYPATSLSCKAGNTTGAVVDKTNNNVLLIVRPKKKVAPVYPANAKTQFIQGTIELLAVVNPQGDVTDLRLISGPFALYHSADEAVKQWRFEPAKLNGSQIAVETKVTINYSLQR
jgi:TonB family protein